MLRRRARLLGGGRAAEHDDEHHHMCYVTVCGGTATTVGRGGGVLKLEIGCGRHMNHECRDPENAENDGGGDVVLFPKLGGW